VLVGVGRRSRNAAPDWLGTAADTGADLLVRIKIGRNLPGLLAAARPQLHLPHRPGRGPCHHGNDHGW
jgi:hypothetical protein